MPDTEQGAGETSTSDTGAFSTTCTRVLVCLSHSTNRDRLEGKGVLLQLLMIGLASAMVQAQANRCMVIQVPQKDEKMSRRDLTH